MRRKRIVGTSESELDEIPEYWITYSDLLVSLLVVFALLLFVALANVQKQREAERGRQAAVRGTMQARDATIKAAAGALGGSSANYDPRTRTLTVRDEVLFAFGSATLRPEAEALISKISRDFLPRLFADTAVGNNIDAIVVEGHTDTVGSYLSNLDLSQKRAQSVMVAIVTATYGTPAAVRLRTVLVASGRSEVEALESGVSYDPQKARRIVMRVRLRDSELLQKLLDTVPIFREAH